MRILGIDPGLRSTGFGVIDERQNTHTRFRIPIHTTDST